MINNKTDVTTEKKELSKFPSIKKEESINIRYLPELGDYFTEHFAYRQELVSLNSYLYTNLFNVSNTDNVIAGRNNWLYYKDSLKDYIGKDIMSDRAIFNVINNIAMMQQYVQNKNKEFIFTIVPNKNSLYYENMPYYYKKVSNDNNLSNLNKEIKRQNINYVDLKSIFEKNKNILYLKRDSHWNNKGALLAYNSILNKKNIKHYYYDGNEPNKQNDYIGDLNLMVYPKFSVPEENYYYDYKQYKYVTDTKSVEEPIIKTKSSYGKNNLLMYRDSFGNTLIPFMSGAFKNATYSKLVPYNITEDLKSSKADVVIIEKVERNIDEFSNMPPIIEGLKFNIRGKEREVYTNTTLECSLSEENRNYIKISGIIDKDWIDSNSEIYIRITNEDNQKLNVYKTFLSTVNNNDYGFTLYLDKSKVNYENAFIEVMGKQKKYLNILYEDAIGFDKF
ncbi:alginate O-acetyltransferase AlgX-related protein [Anaerofustis stercorihominis]|uniref:alginate O-acetyltransferase AlgX-related protein n=1 Tax=Anaerofustis stercorihominis TaxID=214853 RepID=UPI00398421E3